MKITAALSLPFLLGDKQSDPPPLLNSYFYYL